MELRRKAFYFLRHGETDWNRQGLVQGQTDLPLNGKGLAQAREAQDMLRGLGIRTICSSPLKRALLTAEIIAAGLHIPVRVVENLKECNFGSREGQPKGIWYEAWRRGLTPQGAESFRAFLERALDGVNQALEEEGPVLIIAHGGVYWAIERFAGLSRGETVRNAKPIYHRPPPKPLLPWNLLPIAA